MSLKSNKYGIDIKELFNDVKLNGLRNEYITSCPFCGKDKHFYVSVSHLSFSCKKCGEEGGVYKLLSHFGKQYLFQGATIEIVDKLETIKSINENEEDEIELIDLPVIKMPPGWKLSNSNYLRGRGITDEDISRYRFGRTKLIEKYRGFVLLPVYDNGSIRGFLGRYENKKPPAGVLRYNNSERTDFSKLLFGFDEIITGNTKTVIIVEGIFDKIAVDKILNLHEEDVVKCVCSFGKKISPYQMAKLRSKCIVNVILLFDYDAIKQIKQYAFELDKYFFTSITFASNHKDIDEYPVGEAIEVFNKLYRPKEFYYNVIGKIV